MPRDKGRVKKKKKKTFEAGRFASLGNRGLEPSPPGEPQKRSSLLPEELTRACTESDSQMATILPLSPLTGGTRPSHLPTHSIFDCYHTCCIPIGWPVAGGGCTHWARSGAVGTCRLPRWQGGSCEGTDQQFSISGAEVKKQKQFSSGHCDCRVAGGRGCDRRRPCISSYVVPIQLCREDHVPLYDRG